MIGVKVTKSGSLIVAVQRVLEIIRSSGFLPPSKMIFHHNDFRICSFQKGIPEPCTGENNCFKIVEIVILKYR